MSKSSHQTKYLEMDINQVPSILYRHRYQRYTTALNMVVYGKILFSGAYIVKEIDKVSSFRFASTNSDNRLRIQEAVMINQLLDSIRICTCFENYMKAVLLQRGYLINQIKQSKYPSLNYEHTPVKFSDFKKISKVKNHDDLIGWKYDIKKDTIKLHTLIQPDYQKKLRLPPYIVVLLKELIKSRNKLHFHNKLEWNLTEDFFQTIRFTKFWVEKKFTPYWQKLEKDREK
jgi:hypothetical protein